MMTINSSSSIGLLLILICFSLISKSSSSIEEFVKKDNKSISSNHSIVGFWNIFADGAHYLDIVLEQKRVLESSGLLSKLDVIYFTTMGSEITELISSIQRNDKIKHLTHFGDTGPEYLTLNEVYKFCHSNPMSKVLYFHNKGSLNYGILNINFRRALDCFVLNPYCISALDRYDTCGFRLSPLPHVHYSGNYWWSTCQHINKLIHPLSPMNNQTFLQLTATLYATYAASARSNNKRTTTYELPSRRNPFPDQPYLGLGRYFAETWVGSLPRFKPADCLNASMNNRYMWGKAPLPWRLLNKRCPNFKKTFMMSSYMYDDNLLALDMHSMKPTNYLNYGFPCAYAGMIRQPKLMQKRFILSKLNFTEELRNRSLYWYGQEPEFHINWLSIYK